MVIMYKGALVCVLSKLQRVIQSMLRPPSAGVQAWECTGWAAEWCRELGLDLRGMRFAKDVRRQLETIAGPDGASLLRAAERVPGGAPAPDAPAERAHKRRRTEDKGTHPTSMLGGCRVGSMSIGEVVGTVHHLTAAALGCGLQLFAWAPVSAFHMLRTAWRAQPCHMHALNAQPCQRDEMACRAGAERLRRALMLGFANRLARRMPQHNGYKTLGAGATLAQLHPATARIAADDTGLLPEWLIYHELVATARTFLSKACFLPRRSAGRCNAVSVKDGCVWSRRSSRMLQVL